MDPKKTGIIISDARKKVKMTQKDLADKLYVSDKAVSKWERGLCFPDISVLIPLTEILNISLYDLLRGEKVNKKEVEEILKNTINYSNSEINRKKKKYINSFNVKNFSELLALLNAREETETKIQEKSNEIKTIKERIASLEAQLKLIEEKLSSVLGRYFKNPTEDTAELIRRLRDVTEKVAQAKKIAESKKESLLKTTQLLDRAALEEKSIGAVVPERSEEEIEKQLRFVQNGKKLMEDKIIAAEKEKAVLESSVAPPSMLFEKAEATYNKLQWAKRRFDAINTALELIENASDELKRTLAPKITAYASELFNIATDGKYKSLNVTTELSLTTDNGETVKSAEYLSAGGRATAYVCLRLALLKVIYNDTFPPIIFDDAFVRLDKNRLEQIKKAIMSSPAKDTQIFIFSALDI